MTYLQLGRTGDILNILPACHWHWVQSGKPTRVISDISYVGLFDGCSYIEPIAAPFQDFRAVRDAKLWAYGNGIKDVIVTQVRGHNWQPPQTSESYALDSRMRCEVPDEAWEQPIVFDRRDATREAALLVQTEPREPLVLFAGKGFSSPFKDAQTLRGMLAYSAQGCHVLDISNLKCRRIFDLLALYERAACLVTIDSAPLHLAAAVPRLPVVALISDHNEWAGTKPLPAVNLVAKIRYSEWPARADVLMDAVCSVVAKAA